MQRLQVLRNGNEWVSTVTNTVCHRYVLLTRHSEVVLSVLIPTFTFEMPEKNIEWNVAGVWYPSLKEDRATPQMPLNVRPYKGSRV